MITITSFSKGYGFFWDQVAPWLSGYVSSINKGHLERVDAPLTISDDPKIRAINNTIAFYAFVNMVNKGASSVGYKKEREQAFNHLKFLPRNNIDSYKMTKDDQKIIMEQVDRLYGQYKDKNVIANPAFPGSGILLSGCGDLYCKNVLIEVKAGERDLYPSDIKQLLIYSALNSISSNYISIINVELYNPRQGTRYSESLEVIGRMISDRSIEEIYSEIINFSETHCLTSH